MEEDYPWSGQSLDWGRLKVQGTPCLPLPCKRSPDGASTDWGGGYLIAAYYSSIYPKRMKGWVGLVGWPIADSLLTSVVSRQLQVEHRTGKFAGQRPTFYHCTTPPTKRVECTNETWMESYLPLFWGWLTAGLDGWLLLLVWSYNGTSLSNNPNYISPTVINLFSIWVTTNILNYQYFVVFK